MDTAVDFYQGLFTSSNLNNFDTILEQILQVVTKEMNLELMREFVALEVKMALKQMAPLKSPGPNNMPSIFLSKLLVFGW